jgi:hypothetical protein
MKGGRVVRALVAASGPSAFVARASKKGAAE